MSILENYLAISRYLPELFCKTDMAVYATDLEKFLIFDKFGRFKIDIKPGDPLTPGGTPDLVIKGRKTIARYVPREVYGVVCRSICMPVEGGSIGVAFSVENEDEVRLALESANASVEQLSANSSTITTSSQSVVEFMTQLGDSMSKTKAELTSINTVGELIGDIAEDTRYISLNALIEANRAGEHGRSFTVVAKEMQKLSDQTQHSIQTVRANLAKINSHFATLEDQLAKVGFNLQEQSTSNHEMDSAIRVVLKSLREIGDLSKLL